MPTVSNSLNQNSAQPVIPEDHSKIIQALLTDNDGDSNNLDGKPISRPQLLKVIGELFSDIFKPNDLFEIENHSLVRDLQPKLCSLLIDLSPASSTALEMVDRLFDYLVNDASLNAIIKSRINSLRTPYFMILIDDHRLVSQEEHPARTLLNQMVSVGLLWEHNDSRGLQIMTQLSQSVKQIIRSATTQTLLTDKLPGIAQQFQQFFSTLVKRAEIFEKRIRESEEGQARAESAKKWANRSIVNITGKRGTPLFVHHMLTKAWTHVIFLERLKQKSEETSFAVRLAKALIVTLQPIKHISELERFLEIQPDLVNELRQRLEKTSYSYAETKSFLEQLDEFHNSALTRAKSGLDTSPREDIIRLKPSNVFDDNQSDETELPIHNENFLADLTLMEQVEEIFDQLPSENNKAIEQPETIQTRKEKDEAANKKLVEVLKPERWVELHRDNSKIRCKLSTYIDSSDKYVFVSGAGNKVADFKSKELLDAFQEKRIMLLEPRPLFERAFKSIVDEFYSKHKEVLVEAERLAALEKKRLEKVALQKEKQQQEIRKLQQSKTEDNLPQNEGVSNTRTAQNEAIDLAKLKQLAVGSWLEIQVGYKLKKCRLAAKISSTGKYIFTDRSGVKVKECFVEDLLALHQSGKLKLDGENNFFDTALASVISNMREVKSDKT